MTAGHGDEHSPCAEQTVKLIGPPELVLMTLDHQHGQPFGADQLGPSAALGPTGRVQRKCQRQHRVGTDVGTGPASNSGTSAAAPDNKFATRGQSWQRTEHRGPRHIELFRGHRDAPAGDPPGLLNQQNVPSISGQAGQSQQVRRPGLSPGTVPEHQSAAVRRAGVGDPTVHPREPDGRIDIDDLAGVPGRSSGAGGAGTAGLMRRWWAHPLIISPVIGSTTPRSSSRSNGRKSCGPFTALAPTARVTG